MTLPPGQHRVDGFPRFGTHLAKPAPVIPADPEIEITGAVTEPFAVPLTALATLPRREMTADFHCVAGWSATDLRWEGVAFETFYREIVEPALEQGAAVTHIAFRGLDRYRSVVAIEDALAEDVLIAEHLDGRPLDPDHGAPIRLVSPSQYGFISTKHLCRIELLTAEPETAYGSATGQASVGLRMLGFTGFSRARVWEEERGGYLPNWLARPLYRIITPPIAFLSARGGRRPALASAASLAATTCLSATRRSRSNRRTPPTMSRENVEVIRMAAELFNREGPDAVSRKFFADDVEFHDPPDSPSPRVARGRKQVRGQFNSFNEAWAEHTTDLKEARALDADRVLAVSVEHFTGRDGIKVEAEAAAVFTLREGRIVRWQTFWDKQQALEAAGLRE